MASDFTEQEGIDMLSNPPDDLIEQENRILRQENEMLQKRIAELKEALRIEVLYRKDAEDGITMAKGEIAELEELLEQELCICWDQGNGEHSIDCPFYIKVLKKKEEMK